MPPGPDPDVALIELVTYMVEHPEPGFTAAEIAKEYDKTRQWADNRLRDLESKGYLESKNPGGRSKWYWPSTTAKKAVKGNRD